MIEQLKTIRAGLETATCYSMLGVDAHAVQTALTALDQIEKMVGEQEPYGTVTVVRNPGCVDMHWFYRWPDPPYLDNAAECHTVYTSAPPARQYEAGDVASAAAQGFRDGVASVTQEEQARPDFSDEWTGYLKDGETPFERFLRERKDVQSVLKLYQRALEENESLKAQQPQAEAVRWGVDWGTHGDRTCVSIIKKHADGKMEVVATEYEPERKAAPQQAEAVPPGYVLVPVEPTDEMLRAIRRQRSGARIGKGDRADWKVWIAAAIAQQKGGV